MASPAPSASDRGGEVSEAALEFLLAELVNAQRERGEDGRRVMTRAGFDVGVKLAERYTRDRATRFTEPTEAILFVCKDWWTRCFKKRVDNLKTNNRGVYVLTDESFAWMRRVRAAGRTLEEEAAIARAECDARAAFPCGVIRGTLAALGLESNVSAETTPLSPGGGAKVAFTVRLKGAEGGPS